MPGTYSGPIELDPGTDDGPTIELTANVSHPPIWPLLAVVAGVLAAFAVALARDYWRPRELLILNLRRAGELYAQRDESCPADPGQDNWMTGAFRLNAEGRLAPFDSEQNAFGDKAYAEIQAAGDGDGLATAEARVRDLDSLVRLWQDECAAAGDLRSAVDAHAKDLPEPAVITTANELLDREQPIEWDASGGRTLTAQATGYVTELRDQASAIALYDEARTWYKRAQDAWTHLDEGSKDRARQIDPIDPETQWNIDRDKHDTLTEWHSADVDLVMARKLALYRALPVTPVPGPVGAEIAPDEVLAEAWVERTRSALPDRHRVEARPAATILRDLKSFDIRYFVVIALVAMAVYFVTIYPDGNFGSRWQYLTAFLAGLAGTVAIDWLLLPWFRSYRLPDKA